jgi:hypothetical protein
MLLLAIVALLVSIGWSIVVLFANSMSDAPSDGFQGAWTIWACFAVTALLFAAWWIG